MNDRPTEMNAHFARSREDRVALAKAQARLDSLQAAEGTDAAAHKLAYGVRPEHE